MDYLKTDCTKEERLFVYESALELLRINNDRGWGLCYLINMVAHTKEWNGQYIASVFAKNFYPELYAQKPKSTYKQNKEFWWWPYNWKKREKAIVNAIKQLNDAIA